MKLAIAYYNFDTKEYDYLYEPPEDWTSYIPDGVAERGLYSCYVELGDKPIEAARKVLSLCVGEEP